MWDRHYKRELDNRKHTLKGTFCFQKKKKQPKQRFGARVSEENNEEESSKLNQYYQGPTNVTLHSHQYVQYIIHMVPDRYLNIPRRKKLGLLTRKSVLLI